MGLNSKKGVSFTIDALMSVLIVIIIISTLPHLIKDNTNDTEILLTKRYVDSILTALDNSGELDVLLNLNELQGKVYISEKLDEMLTSTYDYNVQIVIDETDYEIFNGVSNDITIVSRRLFFHSQPNNQIKRGYIEVEVWRI